MRSTRTSRSSRLDLTPTRPVPAMYSDDLSFSPGPRPRSASPAPRQFSDRRLLDLKEALRDSETRRDILRDKLRDAQETIQV